MSTALPLDLFGPDPGPVSGAIVVPPVLEEVFDRPDAALIVSISGGKDSQAMLTTLAVMHREHRWRCAIHAIHADLGRAEWPQSRPQCERLCADLGIHLEVVRRPQGDLVQEIQDRQAKLTGTGRSAWPTATQRYCTADQKRLQMEKAKRQPFWPDAANRYCTADQKRTQIDKAVRGPFWPSSESRYCTAHQKTDQIEKELRGYSLVVSAMGMRAEESRARAKKPVFGLDRGLTSSRYADLAPDEGLRAWTNELGAARLAFDWLPIHHWRLEEVWGGCGATGADIERRRGLYRLGHHDDALRGWPAHPAYVFGNERVSCSLCVLASRNDLVVGARHNPELFRLFVQMERESGFTFQHGKSLADLAVEAGVSVEAAA